MTLKLCTDFLWCWEYIFHVGQNSMRNTKYKVGNGAFHRDSSDIASKVWNSLKDSPKVFQHEYRCSSGRARPNVVSSKTAHGEVTMWGTLSEHERTLSEKELNGHTPVSGVTVLPQAAAGCKARCWHLPTFIPVVSCLVGPTALDRLALPPPHPCRSLSTHMHTLPAGSAGHRPGGHVLALVKNPRSCENYLLSLILLMFAQRIAYFLTTGTRS